MAGALLVVAGCSSVASSPSVDPGQSAQPLKGMTSASPADSLSSSTQVTDSASDSSSPSSSSFALASAAPCTLEPGAMCDGADLTGMDLSGRDLSGISLEGATLVDTNFSAATLSNARLTGAKTAGAIWKGTDLTGATTDLSALDPSLEPATTCRTRIAKGAVDSRDCPCRSAGGAAVGFDPWMGGVALGAFPWMPRGYAAAEGQATSLVRNTALYALLGKTWGGDGASNFALPVVTGPWAGVRTGEKGDGACLQWSVATKGIFANVAAESAYPGEIYLSAVANGPLRGSMLEAGAQVDATIGSYLGKGFTAYSIPANWASSEPRDPFVGELRLFTTSLPLPAPFIPANGAAIAEDRSPGLFALLGRSLPLVVAPDGYQWAVASEGQYPQR